jgi:hypothetical protein
MVPPLSTIPNSPNSFPETIVDPFIDPELDEIWPSTLEIKETSAQCPEGTV